MVAQCAVETGWGRFGGVLDASFNNTCGLKTKTGGADDDPDAHARFPDLATGALAHAQHLYRYATDAALPGGMAIVDPRWDKPTPGSAPTVEDLSGRWAGADYGEKVAAVYWRLRGVTP
jgi:N-acetylmuramoyl-L-alanine amidase